MADALSWLQQMLGGGQGAQPGGDALGQLQRRVDRPYDYDQAYQPQALPQSPSAQDALTQLYGMTGIPDMQQAYDAYQRGEYPQALGQGAYGALNAAGVAFPALRGLTIGARAAAPVAREAAGAIPAMLADETGAIRAWHASPYDFDRFDISKVGTGQGAASYGHGIYTAESPRVSGPGGSYDLEFTAKNLGKYDLNQGEAEVLRILRAGGSDLDALGSLARGGGYTFDEAAKVLDRVKAAKAKLYEVDINADPNSFLKWDAPATAQPTGVNDALGRIWQQVGGTLEGRKYPPFAGHEGTRGETLYANVASSLPFGGRPNAEAMQAASEALRAEGVPGIRYLDQGSRFNPATLPDNPIANEARQFLTMANGDSAAALQAFKDSDPISRWGPSERDEVRKVIEAAARQQTHNYVMFDDKLIDIRRKLGLLPPLAGAGLLGAGQGEPPT